MSYYPASGLKHRTIPAYRVGSAVMYRVEYVDMHVDQQKDWVTLGLVDQDLWIPGRVSRVIPSIPMPMYNIADENDVTMAWDVCKDDMVRMVKVEDSGFLTLAKFEDMKRDAAEQMGNNKSPKDRQGDTEKSSRGGTGEGGTKTCGKNSIEDGNDEVEDGERNLNEEDRIAS